MVFNQPYIIIPILKIMWFLWYFNAFVFQFGLDVLIYKVNRFLHPGSQSMSFPIIWWHTHSHWGSSLTFAMTLPEQRSFSSVGLFTSLSGCLCPCVTDQCTQRSAHGTRIYSPFMMLDLCPLLSSQPLQSDAGLGEREGSKEGRRGGQ